MAFRFRRSARLGPLRFHFSKNGLSSISVGGRGASALAIGPRQSGLLALIETPEALSGYVHCFQSQDDAKRRGRRCIEASQLAASQLALQLAATRCWLSASPPLPLADGAQQS